jgi:hypothetical protein
MADLHRIDLYQASVRAQSPAYALCPSYRNVSDVELPILRQRYQTSAAVGFAFPANGLESPLRLLLWDLRVYLDLVESHCSADMSAAWPQQPLASYRNALQHTLLSIPSDPSKPVREVC